MKGIYDAWRTHDAYKAGYYLGKLVVEAGTDILLAIVTAGAGAVAAKAFSKVISNAGKAAKGGASKLTAAGDTFGENASRAAAEDGFHDVIIHGSPTDFGPSPNSWNEGTNISHRTLARLIRQDPGYEGGPIRLISCSTGSCDNGAAQNLANKMGVDVKAPTDVVWAWPSGRLGVGPSQFNTNGGWRTFCPGGC